MKIAKYKNACKETKQGGMRLLLRQANPLRTHFIHAQGCENSKQEKKMCKEVALPDILPAYQTDFNPSPLRPLSHICMDTSVNTAYCKKKS